jgi:oligo-1,6-glucosidase
MLATLLHLKRGTPFIYQGEEIGMTNYPFDDVSEFNDVSSVSNYRYELEKNPDDPLLALKKASIRSRDNARTPMQWSNSVYASFSEVKPYMNVNPNYKKINVESQINDPDSLFHHYKKLIDLRRNSVYKEIILDGDYQLLDKENNETYCYLRTKNHESILVINSFSTKKTTFDVSRFEIETCILSNYKKQTIKNGKIILKPFESVLFKVKEKS